MKKKTYAVAALALTSCLVLGAAAASQDYNVTATFRPDMKLKVNGTTYTIRDTTGQEVSPLIYNGTTYLPLANLGQLLGAEVSWDAATQTVIVTDNASTAAAGAASYLGEAKAKEIALNHAGLTSSQASFLEVKLDRDDGRAVYEVEFYSGNKEYDYEIDAASGAIVSYDFDIEHYTIPSAGTNTGSSTGNYITREKAQQLAQAKAPNATLVKLEFEFDDGRAVYEGELREGRTEYEFEIDAVTGAFLQWSQDRD